MRTLALSFFILMLMASCSNPERKPSEDATPEQSNELSTDQQSVTGSNSPGTIASGPTAGNSDFTIDVFENKDGTGGFGYDILNGGKVTIHQPHIPAVSGTSGFSSKEEAEKVGSLMLMKIKNGIMPPTITVEELDSLGIEVR